MGKLIYITNTSTDGYIEDAAGNFDWMNSAQLFEAITDLIRPVGTYVYGRRLYEKMAYWGGPLDSYAPEVRDFARVWHQADKVVFSRAMTSAPTSRTRIEREFDAEAMRRLKQESPHDLSIGGAELAAIAFDAGLVDECQLFVHPLVVGGGKPAFRIGARLRLDHLATRRFDTGVVQQHYAVRGVSG